MKPIDTYVEPDRVHRHVHTDSAIFEREMTHIWEKIWVYCGHESQVPNVGDFYTVHIGRQPLVMVRGPDGRINVLYNRCPHRGVQLCGSRFGTGSFRKAEPFASNFSEWIW